MGGYAGCHIRAYTCWTGSVSGAEPVGNTPQEFAAVLRVDMAKWAKVVQAAGLSPK